jgi:hypothetical protein
MIMKNGDNVFLIIRKGTGYPRETYFPVQIELVKESSKTADVILPNGKKRNAYLRNLSVKNHRGEINRGKQ